jgi:hypothetical protein
MQAGQGYGLMSYDTNLTDGWRKIGVYTGRILTHGPARGAGEQVPAGHQLANRQGARPRRASDATRARRRGDRDRIDHLSGQAPFLLRCICRLMALFCPANRAEQCPVSGGGLNRSTQHLS